MSLGNDLARIRKSQNLSLEDIQNAVKIPIDILESIEDESIFSDPSKNNTYIRSFVRSYAKVLNIEEDKIVQALDQIEKGEYSGGLLERDTESEQENTSYYGDSLDFKPSAEDSATEKSPVEPGKPKKTSQVETSPAPETDTINWADMSKKFSAAGTNSKIGIVIAVLALIVILVGSTIIFSDNIASLFSSDSPATEQEQMQDSQTQSSEEQIIPVVPDSAVDEPQQLQITQQEDESTADNITLGDTLTVEVYAAYDKLDPVRVTSDLNWQTNPFWMEQGLSYKFDFTDTLLVRGQYNDLILLFNGHIVENPRQNYFDSSYNSILITRSILDQPRFLETPPEEFPLEIGAPDSSTYRLRF